LLFLFTQNGALDDIARTSQLSGTGLPGHPRLCFLVFTFAITLAIPGTVTLTATTVTRSLTVAIPAATPVAITIFTFAIPISISISISIARIWVFRVSVVTAADFDFRIARLRRFFRTEGAVPDIARRALIFGIRRRRFVGVLLAAGTTRVYVGIFRALKPVALVLKRLKDAGRRTAFIDIHIADNVLECVLARR